MSLQEALDIPLAIGQDTLVHYKKARQIPMKSAVKRAISKAGSQSELARLVGVTPQAVQQWEAANRVSVRKALDVEKATGISRHDLRPDIYPKESGQ